VVMYHLLLTTRRFCNVWCAGCGAASTDCLFECADYDYFIHVSFWWWSKFRKLMRSIGFKTCDRYRLRSYEEKYYSTCTPAPPNSMLSVMDWRNLFHYHAPSDCQHGIRTTLNSGVRGGSQDEN